MYGTAGVNTGAAVRPDPTRPHMRESPSPDPRLTPRPRVLAPAAAHEGPARPPQVALRTQEVVDVVSSDEKVLDFPEGGNHFRGKGQAGDGRSEVPGQPRAGRMATVDRLGIAPSRAGLVKLGHVALDGTKISGSDAGICATCITATTSSSWWRNLRG
jgi:hypothetical protein